MKLSMLIGFALIPVLFSCASSETEDSDVVNQDRIYQLLSVDFDAEKSEFEWMASFTLGGPTGTTLELVGDSRVVINEQDMDKITTGFSGTFYLRKDFSEFSKSPNTFLWTDTSGKQFSNSISMNDIGFPDDIPDSFSKSEGITISWVGGEIAAENDWVSIEVKSLSNDELAIKRINDLGKKSITLLVEDIADLGKGEIEIQLSRYTSWIDLTEATSVGGGISYNFYTSKLSATLSD